MAKYKPVPRTLSEIVQRISPSHPQQSPPLVSPEELKKTAEVPLLDPKNLFKNVPPAEPPKRPELRAPEEIFGGQSIAPADQKLLSLEDLQKKQKKGKSR